MIPISATIFGSFTITKPLVFITMIGRLEDVNTCAFAFKLKNKPTRAVIEKYFVLIGIILPDKGTKKLQIPLQKQEAIYANFRKAGIILLV